MSFWQSKTRISKPDRLFSEFIRKRDGRCVYAVKCYGPCDYKFLTTSHFWGRAHRATRFDPENADAACRRCHAWVTDTVEGQQWLRAFKEKQLGSHAYTLLELRHHNYQKKDEAMETLMVKELLKTLPDMVPFNEEQP